MLVALFVVLLWLGRVGTEVVFFKMILLISMGKILLTLTAHIKITEEKSLSAKRPTIVLLILIPGVGTQ